MILRWFQTLVTFSLLAGPRLVQACPQCAQNDSQGPEFLIMLGAMILLPYPVAAGVYFLIRKSDPLAQPFDEESSPNSNGPVGPF